MASKIVASKSVTTNNVPSTDVTSEPPIHRDTRLAGRTLSALPVLCLLVDGVLNATGAASATATFLRLGFPERLASGIGILELALTLLYVVPRTAFIGALLLTAFLGGATVAHVRVGEPFLLPVIVGMLLWAGLFLRNERLLSLLASRAQR